MPDASEKMLTLADKMYSKALRELVTSGRKRVRFSNCFFTIVMYTVEGDSMRHIRTDLFPKRTCEMKKGKNKEG